MSLSYVALIVLVALPAMLALHHAYRATERRVHVSAEGTAAVLRAVSWQESALRMTSAARAYLITGDDAHRATMDEAKAEFVDALPALGDETRSSSLGDSIDTIERAAGEYVGALERMLALRRPARFAPSPELVLLFEQDMLPRQRELGAALRDYIAAREAHMDEVALDAQRSFSDALQIAVTMLLFGLIAAVVVGERSARRLSHWYQAERIASQRAQNAVAARDELLGVVAHDLRSPLAAILLKASLIARSNDRTRIIRHATSIEDISMRMESLIKSLLDTALIEEGQFLVHAVPTPVRRLLDAVQELFATQAAVRDIRLTLALEEPNLHVLADPERMAQALGNVVANALKFTPSGGEVSVTARKEGDAVRIAVRDTGPGIPSADLRHIFDRFWKGQPGGKRGVGLGLYIARTIVEAHGGHLLADSAPGRGSTFSLVLSRSTADASA